MESIRYAWLNFGVIDMPCRVKQSPFGRKSQLMAVGKPANESVRIFQEMEYVCMHFVIVRPTTLPATEDKRKSSRKHSL